MLKNNSFKLEPNGPQLKLNKTLPRTQTVTETMDQSELTAKPQHALVPMDHSMDQLVSHALELNQQPSHTITPTQLPGDHMPPQVTSPTLIHHHHSHPRLLSNLLLTHQLPRPKQSQHQKRSQSLTQRLPRPTLLSMDKSE